MPGAPNKPPETAPAPAPAETPQQRALRRLAPSRVALRLPLWRGAPNPDVLQPYLDAERLYEAGDAEGANGALDRLAIRFAEPRWPSLPEPFRQLRVAIPAPQPPHWDPDHGLPPSEKEARRLRRYAETQLALAGGALEAEAARGTDVAPLAPLLERAKSALAAGELGPPLWEPIDGIWSGLRVRVPIPAPAGAPRPPAPAEDAGA